MNLITDPWIPVRMRAGDTRLIRPSQIVDGLGADIEPIAPAWGRADLDVATHEFLIGLIAATMPPTGKNPWRRLWDTPPDVEALDAAFAPHAVAFDLDGDGPRFMQDLERFEDGAPDRIERLLLDAPGDNALKKNSDVLSHRDRHADFDLAMAAIALYALQQFAPSGGAGNRTSMRGGGPLTVLALPPEGAAAGLWRTVWLNTPIGAPVEPADPRVFPWMAPTRTSENDRATLPDDGNQREHANPAQAFFGMPRRLRLAFENGRAVGFHQKPRGVKYVGWRHPLSPYYRQKPATELLPAHPKPGRFGYRDWMAATAGDGTGLREPARSIADAKERLIGAGQARALIAGWAMNNMEAEDYLLAVQPLHLAEAQEALDSLARQMVVAGDAAWAATRTALRRALLDDATAKADDTALFDAARLTFFDRSDDAFHRTLAAAKDAPDADAPRTTWLGVLQRTAQAVFWDVVRPTITDPAGARGKAAATAARFLTADLNGWNAKKNPIHEALGLDATGPARAARKRKATA